MCTWNQSTDSETQVSSIVRYWTVVGAKTWFFRPSGNKDKLAASSVLQCEQQQLPSFISFLAFHSHHSSPVIFLWWCRICLQQDWNKTRSKIVISCQKNCYCKNAIFPFLSVEEMLAQSKMAVSDDTAANGKHLAGDTFLGEIRFDISTCQPVTRPLSSYLLEFIHSLMYISFLPPLIFLAHRPRSVCPSLRNWTRLVSLEPR